VIIRRGDVYLARLGDEGADSFPETPIFVVSRDSLNQNSPVIVVVPVIEKTGKKRIYPSQCPIRSGDGGITADSIALGEKGTCALSALIGTYRVASISLAADIEALD
jgi:mRNA interferase MazF